MDSKEINNNEECAIQPSIVQDALIYKPKHWKLANYSCIPYEYLPVHGKERRNVVDVLPEELRQKAIVYRLQNPFMFTRSLARYMQLFKRDIQLYESTRYHPIFEKDKFRVMKYNLDWRRYISPWEDEDKFRVREYNDLDWKKYVNPWKYKKLHFGWDVQEERKPILFSDPCKALDKVRQFCKKQSKEFCLKDVMLIVVKVMEEKSDRNVDMLTKARDTEYYPEYFVSFK